MNKAAVLSVESVEMTREQRRTKYRQRQKRRRRPPFLYTFAWTRRGRKASTTAGAPRGEPHI